MSAYTLLALSFMLYVGCLVEARKSCYQQLDCKETECCCKEAFSSKAYCKNKLRFREKCIEVEYINGIYEFICPCFGDLKCTKETSIDSSGKKFIGGNTICLPTHYRPEEMNEQKSYNNEKAVF
ncbi:toxin CSTX-20 [Parasteatoda tepidariorum]|uniref:toxin CSTX-20 n=1 Tax=Parasteatoda tepidariorum TaxID=114398 RepID=UPI00077F9ABE|nr:uncharacterized protein LOC107450303 [Parasteatoda tepidariorum]